jgi:chromosome segregation ATPase
MEESKKQPTWKTILIWGAGIGAVGLWILIIAGVSNALFSGAFKKKTTPPVQQELSDNLEITQREVEQKLSKDLEITQREVEQEIYDLEKEKTLELDLQESRATLARLKAKIAELEGKSEKKIDTNYNNTDKKLELNNKEIEKEATESTSEQQKIQATNQLQSDMIKYNSAMELLQIDCEYQLNSLESEQQNAINAEIGKQVAGGTGDGCNEPGLQCYIAISRIRDSYEEQFNYVEAVCVSKWKALVATKYW